MSRLVMKFGGTSVGTAAMLQTTADLIIQHAAEWDEMVVVISAMAGTTDAVIDCLQSAQEHTSQYRSKSAAIKNKTLQVIQSLDLEPDTFGSLKSVVEKKCTFLSQLCREVIKTGSIEPEIYDAAVSIGEWINIHVLSALLTEKGSPASPLHGPEVIITNNVHTNAVHLQPQSRQQAQQSVLPLLNAGIIPVISGFCGANEEGATTTLGREGSDYSAAIMAESLLADEIWIWSDVNGILTSDPQQFEEAIQIPEMSYDEVYELAFNGARVLHPKTIIPAKNAGIPVRVRNTFEPDNPGTLICKDCKADLSLVKAVTSNDSVNLITLKKRAAEDSTLFEEKAREALMREGIDLLGTFQSQSSADLHLAVSTEVSETRIPRVEEALNALLPGRSFSRLKMRNNQAIVTAVGKEIRSKPRAAARIYLALQRVGIRFEDMSFPKSDHSLSFLLPCADSSRAVRQIHTEVILNGFF